MKSLRLRLWLQPSPTDFIFRASEGQKPTGWSKNDAMQKFVATHNNVNYSRVSTLEVIHMPKLPLSIETEDRIRAMAHCLWLEEGQPDGRAESHWLKAVDLVNVQVSEAATAAPKSQKSAPAAPKKLAAAAAVKKAAPRKRG